MWEKPPPRLVDVEVVGNTEEKRNVRREIIRVLVMKQEQNKAI